MPVLVMKFGGTSVATLDRIRRAAHHLRPAGASLIARHRGSLSRSAALFRELERELVNRAPGNPIGLRHVVGSVSNRHLAQCRQHVLF